MDLLTRGLSKFMLSQFNPCSAVLKQKLQESNTAKEYNDQLSLPFHTLKDVWEEIYPAVPKNLKITPNERYERTRSKKMTKNNKLNINNDNHLDGGGLGHHHQAIPFQTMEIKTQVELTECTSIHLIQKMEQHCSYVMLNYLETNPFLDNLKSYFPLITRVWLAILS